MAAIGLKVECPVCTVAVGEECITIKFEVPKVRPIHIERTQAAKEAGFVPAKGPGTVRAPGEKRAPKAAPPPPSEPAPVAHLDPAYPGPFLCDYVMFKLKFAGKEESDGNTGRVLAIAGERGERITVRPTPAIGLNIPWQGKHENDHTISREQLEGWWPQEQEAKAPKNMRKVNRW